MRDKQLILRQTFAEEINGYWDGGAKHTFDWRIEHMWEDVSRVCSWGANHYFPVKTGKTPKATLGNARRALAMKAKHAGKECTFEYIEE